MLSLTNTSLFIVSCAIYSKCAVFGKSTQPLGSEDEIHVTLEHVPALADSSNENVGDF
jgi:hypothetical protein